MNIIRIFATVKEKNTFVYNDHSASPNYYFL